jgi:hypothetical protein
MSLYIIIISLFLFIKIFFLIKAYIFNIHKYYYNRLLYNVKVFESLLKIIKKQTLKF